MLLALTALLALHPVTFTQPTSIEVEPSGKILVVQNNPGRVLRLDPGTGKVTVVVRSLRRPYAISRARSGATYVSAGTSVLRIDGGVRTAFSSTQSIGPIVAAPDGSVYWATGSGLFHDGQPVGAGTSLSSPHGLALARDGSLLVSDTDHDRVLRVAGDRVTVFAKVASPRGIDVAADGTVRVIDSVNRKLVRLSSAGKRLGAVGPFPGDPYDVSGPYVLQAGQVGTILKITGERFSTIRA